MARRLYPTVPLPDLIEIIPPSAPPGRGSRSPDPETLNRALLLAALARVVDAARRPWSDDTEVMVDCLRRPDSEIHVEAEPDERANRTMRVTGRAGDSHGGTPAPLELHVEGNAGTAARFLAAMVCLRGACTAWWRARMHERPQAG